MPVKFVVVANFENGQDAGDKPGEYQFWVEREHLDETLPVRGATGVIRRNSQGLYGLLLENLTAFLIDARFDYVIGRKESARVPGHIVRVLREQGCQFADQLCGHSSTIIYKSLEGQFKQRTEQPKPPTDGA